jgi:hypothetical protein
MRAVFAAVIREDFLTVESVRPPLFRPVFISERVLIARTRVSRGKSGQSRAR